MKKPKHEILYFEKSRNPVTDTPCSICNEPFTPENAVDTICPECYQQECYEQSIDSGSEEVSNEITIELEWYTR